MQFLTIILGLTASISAIDVSLRVRSNCDSRSGGYTCTNVDPNVNILSFHKSGTLLNHTFSKLPPQRCCGVPSGSYASVVFYAVPTNWFLELRGHEGSNCNILKTIDTLFGGTEKCLNSGPYTGGGYGFRSKKREAQEGACSSTSENCTPIMPDVLFLGDGQKYNIIDMDHGLIEKLAEFAQNESVVADIPEALKPFEIAASRSIVLCYWLLGEIGIVRCCCMLCWCQKTVDQFIRWIGRFAFNCCLECSMRRRRCFLRGHKTKENLRLFLIPPLRVRVITSQIIAMKVIIIALKFRNYSIKVTVVISIVEPTRSFNLSDRLSITHVVEKST